MAALKLKPLVLCGPSGAGKSTLLNHILSDFPGQFGFSVSHTTRKPRQGEIHGINYYFISREEMQQQIASGQFIEHTTFNGNLYGTSKAAIEQVQNQNKVCVLDIDVEGVKQVKQTDLNPWYVFIKPPSLKALADRLRLRGSESEASIDHRLQIATVELEYGTTDNFNIVIINDNLENAYKQLKAFIIDNVLQSKSE